MESNMDSLLSLMTTDMAPSLTTTDMAPLMVLIPLGDCSGSYARGVPRKKRRTDSLVEAAGFQGPIVNIQENFHSTVAPVVLMMDQSNQDLPVNQFTEVVTTVDIPVDVLGHPLYEILSTF